MLQVLDRKLQRMNDLLLDLIQRVKIHVLLRSYNACAAECLNGLVDPVLFGQIVNGFQRMLHLKEQIPMMLGRQTLSSSSILAFMALPPSQ